MALPSTGTLALSRIANTDGANSVGVVTPYTLGQLTTLAGVGGYWDGGWFWSNRSISAFYNYAGYGFKYGSPAILHDYGLSSRYSTSSSSIIDTSGNARTGTFTSGTGNGTAINIPSGYYDTVYPAKIRTNDPSPTDYAIRLEDTAKFGGTSSFTWLTWFRCTSFPTAYPGLISCEGRSSGIPIGHTMHLVGDATKRLDYVRWNGTSNSGITLSVTFNSGIVPAFQFNKWYMAAISFNGSTARLSIFINGTEYAASTSVSTSVSTSASWGVFNGLRYNNFLDGYFGYTACYSSALVSSALYDINAITRLRYE